MPKKSGLGKGLASLMGEANAEVGGLNPETTLPISSIKTNPKQPRRSFDETKLSELADSIKNNGVLQPILVRKKGASYQIVAGERRFQAAKLAGIREIPVVVRDVSDEEVFQLALIENLQRADLNPIEEALGYRQLIDDKGLTQEELGKLISKSRSSIANTLRLLDLPKEVQDLMEEGELSAGHARAILAVPTQEGRERLARKVIDEHLTVRQTENLAPLFSGIESERKPRTPSPQSFKRAARQLKRALGVGVKVRQVRGKNKIEIEFKDEEELARIVESIEMGREVGE